MSKVKDQLSKMIYEVAVEKNYAAGEKILSNVMEQKIADHVKSIHEQLELKDKKVLRESDNNKKKNKILKEEQGNVRYPDVTVQLTGEDGNAFAILGKVRKALRRADASSEELKQFTDEATSGDYDHLLQTAMKWVNVK